MKLAVLAFLQPRKLLQPETATVRKSFILKSVKKYKAVTCWKVWKERKESYYQLYKQILL